MDFEAYREPELRSARLVLEPLTAWHGESLFGLLKDPMLYTYIAKEPPLAASHLSRRFEALEQRRSADGEELWLNWAVRIAAGGYAGLVEATVRGDATALVAWWTFLPFQRRGYGREAAAAVLDHLRSIGVREAAAFIDTRNTASIRLAEALGFVRAGTHAMREKVRGRWIDDHEYRKVL
ncbi:MAG: GNAT family N-acetyltransferase [Alphaproteobacteria bacterium]|nr:GNAT family N-acetyltransferase [Alphaproteobacteria bacterium]